MAPTGGRAATVGCQASPAACHSGCADNARANGVWTLTRKAGQNRALSVPCRPMRNRMILTAIAVGMIAAACSSGGSSHASATSTTTAATTTTATAAGSTSQANASGPATTTTVGASATTSTSTPTGAQDLVIPDSVRAQLLAAGAESRRLSAADFTGLAKGLTYTAYDSTTKTYWAGAQLVPSSSSTQAQVSSQDDGSYDILEQAPGGTWQVSATGATSEPGSSCPVAIPASVLQVWGWAAGTCLPPNH